MSTNHTTNYNLCQWEAEDQVKRTDFNTDNAKLDAALTGKLGRSELIKTVSVPGGFSGFQLSLEDINWNEWEYVSFFFFVPTNALKDRSAFLRCTLSGKNGGINSYGGKHTDSFAYSGPYSFFVMVFPRHDENSKILGVCISNECSASITEVPFSQLESLYLNYTSSSYNMGQGITVTIYGIR